MSRCTSAAERQLPQLPSAKRQNKIKTVPGRGKTKAKAEFGDCVNRLAQVRIAREEPQGANQMAAPAEPTTPNLHRANESLLESAYGSMATAADSAKARSSREKRRIPLTPTGLLMEGDYTQISSPFDLPHI